MWEGRDPSVQLTQAPLERPCTHTGTSHDVEATGTRGGSVRGRPTVPHMTDDSSRGTSRCPTHLHDDVSRDQGLARQAAADDLGALKTVG